MALPADRLDARRLRRKNLWLALALAGFAVGLAASVFIWRASQHAPLMPASGGYAAGYGR